MARATVEQHEIDPRPRCGGFILRAKLPILYLNVWPLDCEQLREQHAEILRIGNNQEAWHRGRSFLGSKNAVGSLSSGFAVLSAKEVNNSAKPPQRRADEPPVRVVRSRHQAAGLMPTRSGSSSSIYRRNANRPRGVMSAMSPTSSHNVSQSRGPVSGQ